MPASTVGTDTIFDGIIAESLQDQRALQRRAQIAGQQLHELTMQSALQLNNLVMTNAAHIQQVTQQAFLRGFIGDADVSSSYRGNHLKKGSEVDVQEATAEGTEYRSEAAAHFPESQELLGNSLASVMDKLTAAIALAQQLTKISQSTPPETAVPPAK